MANLPTDDQLSETLRKYKRVGNLKDLAAVVGLSYRTLYRHSEDDDERPDMGATTRSALIRAFASHGLVGSYSGMDLIEAEASIREEAETLVAPTAAPADGDGQRRRDPRTIAEEGDSDRGLEGTGTE